jgi:hypothetical protein
MPSAHRNATERQAEFSHSSAVGPVDEAPSTSSAGLSTTTGKVRQKPHTKIRTAVARANAALMTNCAHHHNQHHRHPPAPPPLRASLDGGLYFCNMIYYASLTRLSQRAARGLVRDAAGQRYAAGIFYPLAAEGYAHTGPAVVARVVDAASAATGAAPDHSQGSSLRTPRLQLTAVAAAAKDIDDDRQMQPMPPPLQPLVALAAATTTDASGSTTASSSNAPVPALLVLPTASLFINVLPFGALVPAARYAPGTGQTSFDYADDECEGAAKTEVRLQAASISAFLSRFLPTLLPDT